jgi:hypothetical protein
MTDDDPIPDAIEDAGAPTESDSDRNGFLSYHAESHAVGVGLGVGFVAIATGNIQYIGLVWPAITAGLRAKNKEFGKILTDVRQEPHYAAGGLVAGAVLGVVARLAMGLAAVPALPI